MKACTKCGETKALADFHRNDMHKSGRNSACIACERARALARYYKHRDAILAKARTPEAKHERKMRRNGVSW